MKWFISIFTKDYMDLNTISLHMELYSDIYVGTYIKDTL